MPPAILVIGGLSAAEALGLTAVTGATIGLGVWNEVETRNNMAALQSKAKAKAKPVAGVKAKACAACKEDCEEFRCGIPTEKYRGGAHGCMSGTEETRYDELDSHHIPADAFSPLPKNDGIALQMDPWDHAETASYKWKALSPGYANQRNLLASGQTYQAFLEDAQDVRNVAAKMGYPHKYDSALAQATAYANCLKQHGAIN